MKGFRLVSQGKICQTMTVKLGVRFENFRVCYNFPMKKTHKFIFLNKSKEDNFHSNTYSRLFLGQFVKLNLQDFIIFILADCILQWSSCII